MIHCKSLENLVNNIQGETWIKTISLLPFQRIIIDNNNIHKKSTGKQNTSEQATDERLLRCSTDDTVRNAIRNRYLFPW